MYKGQLCHGISIGNNRSRRRQTHGHIRICGMRPARYALKESEGQLGHSRQIRPEYIHNSFWINRSPGKDLKISKQAGPNLTPTVPNISSINKCVLFFLFHPFAALNLFSILSSSHPHIFPSSFFYFSYLPIFPFSHLPLPVPPLCPVSMFLNSRILRL